MSDDLDQEIRQALRDWKRARRESDYAAALMRIDLERQRNAPHIPQDR